VLACHVPVAVRVVGRLDDERLRLLADRVEAAVARRLAEAGRTLPAGAALVHPPGPVRVSGDVAEPERARLTEALRAAVARATRDLTATGPTVRSGSAGSALPAGRVSVPFGAPAGHSAGPFPGQPLPAGEPVGWRDAEHGPTGPAGEVREGGSPFDGQPVAALGGLAPVVVRSPRYALAGTLTMAVQLGLVIFAVGSFAVIEGPDGLYWAVGTDPAVAAAELSAGLLPDALLVPSAMAAGRTYRLRGLITRDRRPVWRDRDAGVAWLHQLAAEARAGVAPLLGDQVQAAVVAGADQLVAQLVAAGEAGLPAPGARPVALDRAAFALVPWADKARYLRALLAATPWTEQRRTAVEVIAALADGAEVDAMVALLRETGLHGRLFDEPEPDAYALLRTIGERFPREPGRLGAGALTSLLRRFDLLPRRLHEEALIGVTAGPRGITVPAEVLDSARDSAAALVAAGTALGESVRGLFTSPQLLARALAALAQLLVTVRLASLGYRPAARELDRFLDRLPLGVLATVRGAERLAVPDRTLRRLQWREIWEIASAYGPHDTATGEPGQPAAGEVSGDATGVLRVVDLLARRGEPVQPGTLAARLVTLAGVLAAERPDLGAANAVIALLAGLPEGQLHRLGQLLARTPVAPGATLAELAATSADLHAAAVDALAAVTAPATDHPGGEG
jgi:hypothetical protein